MKKFANIKLLRDFTYVSGIYFLGIMLLLTMNIVLARTLSVADYGIFGFIFSIVTVMSIPVSGGLPILLTREVAGYAQIGNWAAYRGLVAACLWWVALTTFMVGSLFLTWSLAFKEISNHYLLIIFFLIFFIGLNSARSGILRGFGRPLLAEAPSQILQPMLIILAYLMLASFGFASLTNLLWSYLAVMVSVYGLTSIILRRTKTLMVYAPSSDLTDKQRWLRSLFSLTMISATYVLSTQAAVLISGFMGQEEVVAYLRVAERGVMFMIVPFHILSSVIGPNIVAAISSGDIRNQRAVVRQSSQLIFFTTLPLTIITLLIGEQIIALLFGAPYDENSYLPMLIVSITQVSSMVFGNMAMLLIMAGRERLLLASQVIALCINVFFCIILIEDFGAVGASIGISLGILASTFMNVLLIKRCLGFTPGIFLR